jgi:hypothetical protein
MFQEHFVRPVLASVTILIVAAAVSAYGSDNTRARADNGELAELHAEDQADRNLGYEDIDWSVVSERDEKRRSRALELLRLGELHTSEDFRRAALIFQHGATVEDARLALSLAWVAASIDPDNDKAKWLTAAAWDRLMMWQGQPQWYGTQFRKEEDGQWRLYPIDEDAVTDEQRQALKVPTLDETRLRLAKRNET